MYMEVNMAGRLNKIDISDIFWECFALIYIFKIQCVRIYVYTINYK